MWPTNYDNLNIDNDTADPFTLVPWPGSVFISVLFRDVHTLRANLEPSLVIHSSWWSAFIWGGGGLVSYKSLQIWIIWYIGRWTIMFVCLARDVPQASGEVCNGGPKFVAWGTCLATDGPLYSPHPSPVQLMSLQEAKRVLHRGELSEFRAFMRTDPVIRIWL